MTKAVAPTPQAPFPLFVRRCRRALAGVVALSAMANSLALTGSLYMLQVYDRVLPSRSLPTLVGLTVLMVGLYAAFGALDLLRNRVMQGLSIRLDRQLREPVFRATLRLPLHLGDHRTALQPVRDLDQIRGFLASPGPIALVDMPSLPFYLALVFLLHPLLGLLATAGALVLVGFTALAELLSRKPAQSSTQAAGARQGFMDAAYRNAELVQALGLERRMTDRWEEQNEALLIAQRRAVRVTSSLGGASRVFRLVLQSALLGLGAYIVIQDEATGGVMFAASLLTSRALAPIESAIANWRGFVSARQSYQRLSMLLASLPDEAPPLALPAPRHRLTVEDLAVAAPGQRKPILQGIVFTLQAGEGLGVIGPSASGKSTLARALAGAWLPLRGVIRLDGAALDQWDRNVLGRHVGYLPQDLALFDGTIAENIARLEENAPSEAVIAAGLHARRLDKKAVLINTTWHANSARYAELASHFDMVSVRESRSADELADAGICPRIVPDLALYHQPPEGLPRDGTGYTDCVVGSTALVLHSRMAMFRAEPISLLHDRHTMRDFMLSLRRFLPGWSALHPGTALAALRGAVTDWHSQLADREAFSAWVASRRLIVTGRFHMLIFALAARTPVLTVRSNTHKIEATLADAGLASWRCVDAGTIDAAVLERAGCWGDDEEHRLAAYIAEGRKKMRQLFADIRTLL